MQILIAGSASEDRANILEALAKIKPEFSVMFIDRDHSFESIRGISKALEMTCEQVDMPEYIPSQKTKYTCKGELKRR